MTSSLSTKKSLIRNICENGMDCLHQKHGETLFLREISAIEMKSIQFRHKLNELQKGRRR